MDKLVLFDIDHTLFDTDVYREELFTTLGEAIGFSGETALRKAKEAAEITRKMTGHFDPDIFLEQLSSFSVVDTLLSDLETIFWQETYYENALYKGVQETIAKLQAEKVTVGIFSTGDERHQRAKIQQIADLLPHEHVYIFRDKVQELRRVFARFSGQKIYFVDDLPVVLMAVKHEYPEVTTIWSKRHNDFTSDDLPEGFKPDKIITEVYEVVQIVLEK